MFVSCCVTQRLSAIGTNHFKWWTPFYSTREFGNVTIQIGFQYVPRPCEAIAIEVENYFRASGGGRKETEGTHVFSTLKISIQSRSNSIIFQNTWMDQNPFVRMVVFLGSKSFWCNILINGTDHLTVNKATLQVYRIIHFDGLICQRKSSIKHQLTDFLLHFAYFFSLPLNTFLPIISSIFENKLDGKTYILHFWTDLKSIE